MGNQGGVDITASNVMAIMGGSLGIETTNPNDGIVEVKGGTVCVDTNSDDSATSCISTESDIRLKKNIEPITGALDKLAAIRGVTFDWRWDEYETISRYRAKPHDVGVIAQDVEKVLPEAMDEEIDGFKSVSYHRLTPLLIEAIKEQQAEIEAQREQINALRADLEALKSQAQPQ